MQTNEEIKKEFEKRFYVRVGEISITKGLKDLDKLELLEAGKLACEDVLSIQKQQMIEKGEELKKNPKKDIVFCSSYEIAITDYQNLIKE